MLTWGGSRSFARDIGNDASRPLNQFCIESLCGQEYCESFRHHRELCRQLVERSRFEAENDEQREQRGVDRVVGEEREEKARGSEGQAVAQEVSPMSLDNLTAVEQALALRVPLKVEAVEGVDPAVVYKREQCADPREYRQEHRYHDEYARQTDRHDLLRDVFEDPFQRA